METKQTSIEWLWDAIDNEIPFQDIKTSQVFKGILEQAKEMHKGEIVDANLHGFKEVHEKSKFGKLLINQAEKYYNETYGN